MGTERAFSISMKKIILPILLALPVILSSCATPQQSPVAFHKTDNTTLVIQSLNDRTSQMVQPTSSAMEDNDKVLAQAKTMQSHQTAVVILENYTEPQPGRQFQARGTPLFIGLRGLGYEHIYFLQGKGVADPENLPTVIEYK
jgi:D-serine deaminase-like pyridoxal phosphate-dependent protein